jgi:hypothetical protein
MDQVGCALTSAENEDLLLRAAGRCDGWASYKMGLRTGTCNPGRIVVLSETSGRSVRGLKCSPA